MNLDLDQPQDARRAQAPPATTGPLLPTQAVFRQKPWLPWWLAIVVPLLALLALLLFLFLPKNVDGARGRRQGVGVRGRAGDHRGQAASSRRRRRRRSTPKVAARHRDRARRPRPARAAEEGNEVAIQVAVGNGKVKVPEVAGKTPADAEKILREATLTLGQATPQPVDPEGDDRDPDPGRRGDRQGGRAGRHLPEGAGARPRGRRPARRAARNAAAGGGGGGGGGGDEAGAVVVPAVDGATAGRLRAEGRRRAARARGQARVRRQRRQGRAVPGRARAGDRGGARAAKVKIFVSAGFPQLAYDDDRDVLLVDARRRQGARPDRQGLAARAGPDVERRRQRDRLHERRPGLPLQPRAAGLDRGPADAEGRAFSDLAWAPTTEANVLALAQKTDTASDLCFGAISGEGMEPRCKDEPNLTIERKINWSPDGSRSSCSGVKAGTTAFGMVRWSTEKPFSAERRTTGPRAGSSPTRRSRARACSTPRSRPTASRWRSRELERDGRAELFLTKRNDFLLEDAKELGVRACKVDLAARRARARRRAGR